MREVSKPATIVGAKLLLDNGEEIIRRFGPIVASPGDTYTLTWKIDFTNISLNEVITSASVKIDLGDSE